MTEKQAIKGQYIVSIGGEAMKKRLFDEMATDCEDVEKLRKDLKSMKPMELFSAWMNYDGILGYDELMIRMLRESGFVVEPVEAEG